MVAGQMSFFDTGWNFRPVSTITRNRILNTYIRIYKFALQYGIKSILRIMSLTSENNLKCLFDAFKVLILEFVISKHPTEFL